MKKLKRKLFISLGLLCAFIAWTVVVSTFDVAKIGPLDSAVGLSHMNGFFHTLTGVHLSLYNLTDALTLIPLAVCAFFAFLGLFQWIKRKSLKKVDPSVFVLGGFYAATLLAFLLFEKVKINYRPVLIDGALEASYPSSTTLISMCVFPTLAMQLAERIKKKPLRTSLCAAACAFGAFMVVCRLISGVHWLSDIIGGALLSAFLVTLYDFFVSLYKRK